MRPLFRKKALDHYQSAHQGVISAQGGPLQLALVLLIAALTIAIVLYLCLGKIARKQTISGLLQPPGGITKLYAPYAAQVIEKHVNDGDSVSKGQVIYVLSAARASLEAASIEDAVRQQLLAQRERLNRQISSEQLASGSDAQGLQQRLQSLQAQQQKLQAQLATHGQRLNISAASLQQQQQLAKGGYVSTTTVQEQATRHLALQAEGQALQRELLALQQQSSEAQAQLRSNDLRSEGHASDYATELSNVEKQLAELNSRTAIVIRSPCAGRVTGLLLQPGQAANPLSPLATVLPQGAPLQALLYAPSRAIGFIKPGQTVKLRLHAFPYTRFGSQTGQVVQVSRALLLPSETANLPNNEAAYPVIVRLDNQALSAYGERWPLQAGMTLEADIVMEQQLIFQWIIEPLRALRS